MYLNRLLLFALSILFKSLIFLCSFIFTVFLDLGAVGDLTRNSVSICGFIDSRIAILSVRVGIISSLKFHFANKLINPFVVIVE